MSVDVVDLRDFYDTALGGVARRFVGRVLRGYWPDLRRESLLGLGYAAPYLPGPGAGCERALAFMPAQQGVVNWPAAGPSASALVDPLAMPLSDNAMDRILVVHALEVSEDPAELLHEVSRILRPAGRAILVCPNRRGLWARMDTTPFGHGQPFSRSQLRRLMQGSFLQPERWSEALYGPPFRSRLTLSGATAWERLGVGLSLPFAGVHIVEASKQMQRPVAVRERRRVLRRQPAFVPAPASCAPAGLP